ncbi:MAG: SDR family NAD(P)-dependent oxidoreductase [Bacteroidetes bacterium]|nr:SDR family NAD(P)-dependent oxidoreductase [Bacteroidota bacterium]
MGSLEGTSAIVTGASSGIGAAIAASLAREGAGVVLAARNEARLRSVAATLTNPERHLVVVADVGDEAAVQRMVRAAVERYGTVGILVNNAGFGTFKPIVEMETEEFDGVIRANLRGPFLCMKHVLPLMYERERGTVITISSIAGKHGFAGGSAYCASKFGVMGLMECTFHEARGHNVRMVSVCPGSVDTRFFDEAHTTSPNRDRILQPADVAAAVMLAITLPEQALLRELDIRPTNPGRP